MSTNPAPVTESRTSTFASGFTPLAPEAPAASVFGPVPDVAQSWAPTTVASKRGPLLPALITLAVLATGFLGYQVFRAGLASDTVLEVTHVDLVADRTCNPDLSAVQALQDSLPHLPDDLRNWVSANLDDLYGIYGPANQQVSFTGTPTEQNAGFNGCDRLSWLTFYVNRAVGDGDEAYLALFHEGQFVGNTDRTVITAPPVRGDNDMMVITVVDNTGSGTTDATFEWDNDVSAVVVSPNPPPTTIIWRPGPPITVATRPPVGPGPRPPTAPVDADGSDSAVIAQPEGIVAEPDVEDGNDINAYDPTLTAAARQAVIDGCVADLNWGLDTVLATIPPEQIYTYDLDGVTNIAIRGRGESWDPETGVTAFHGADFSEVDARFGRTDGRTQAVYAWYENMYEIMGDGWSWGTHRNTIPAYCAYLADNGATAWPPTADHPIPSPLSIPEFAVPRYWASHADLTPNGEQCFTDLWWGVNTQRMAGWIDTVASEWVPERFGSTDGRLAAAEFWSRRWGDAGGMFIWSGLPEEVIDYFRTVTTEQGIWPPNPNTPIPDPASFVRPLSELDLWW